MNRKGVMMIILAFALGYLLNTMFPFTEGYESKPNTGDDSKLYTKLQLRTIGGQVVNKCEDKDKKFCSEAMGIFNTMLDDEPSYNCKLISS